MDFPRLGSRSASLPTPSLVERLSWKRERWLTAVRARSGPTWVGLDAVQSFAAQRPRRWAHFLALRRGDAAYPWQAMSMEHVFPVLSAWPRLPMRFSPAILGLTQGALQPSPPFPVGRMPASMPRPWPGRLTGHYAPLPGKPAGFMASQGMAPRQAARVQDILAEGQPPRFTDREWSFWSREDPGDPRPLLGAEPRPARVLRSPTLRWLAVWRHPPPDVPAAPTPLPSPAIRLTTGIPLGPILRARLEPSLGFDLGGVRLHTDSAASSLALRLGAQAFTVGPHIFFAAGRFQPQTRQGLALLAHELTHVNQQPEGRPWPWGQLTNTAHRALEQEAEVQAQAVLAHVDHPAFSPRVLRQMPMNRSPDDVFEVAAAPSEAGMGLPPLILSYATRALPVVPLRQAMTADGPAAPVPPMTTTPGTTPASPAAEVLDPEQLAEQVYAWIQRRQRLERERRGIQQWH